MVAASPLRTTELRLAPDGATVVVDGDEVVVEALVETDPDVVRLVAAAEDAESAVRHCLRVGARALIAANVDLETQVVEQRFEAMAERFEAQLDDACTQIAQRAGELLDADDGALTRTLAAHKAELERCLGDTFDPDSKRSALALVERMLAEAKQEHVRAVQRVVAPDGDDSPLARTRQEIVREVSNHLEPLRAEVRTLTERIAVQEAVDPVLERTAGKGLKFEEVVDACVGRFAAQHGDVAERCGTERGPGGTMKGDELVTLCEDDSNGYEACFVLEAKSKKLTMRATLHELEEAMANREALAGIAVFATQDQAPTSVPFHHLGNKAIVVLDKDGTDDTALRLAYMWARWQVRRQLTSTAADELDVERITGLIGDAARAIDRCSNVRRQHSTIRKAVDIAASEVDQLAEEARTALDAIGAELAAAADADPDPT